MHIMSKKKALMWVLGSVAATVTLIFAWFVFQHLREEYHFYLHFPANILSDKVHTRTKTADELADKVRVLCFVTTMHGKEENAVAVNATWLKRCTRHLFVSSSPLNFFSQDEVLVLTEVPEGRDHLTAKTFAALKYLYQHELDKFDWFIKADDDSYLIVENLRLLLSRYSPDNPVYLGHHYQSKRWKAGNGYMSGGASYVLSRQALRIMVEKGLPENGGVCRPQEPDEDVEVGKCLYALGIQPHTTVDVYGRETFHPGHLQEAYFTARDSGYSIHPKQMGPNCCSQLTITFHHLSVKTIYTLELLLYHIDVYGRHSDDATLRQTLFKSGEELLPPKDNEDEALNLSY
ncbi:glycoprotein-N-acetylgalactosamine 3-beta-galactosyltransferase 1-like isoform X2 [Babylonia areolata]|uniref:glycoprotein-N-acetylgalactosamine 3-beta-galactosyltransferase 1-like isoform X2 n=1 Tax=Babylonia areolata TaxID=304850 RepID=UPI003FD23E5D